jgi:hypothetical protein
MLQKGGGAPTATGANRPIDVATAAIVLKMTTPSPMLRPAHDLQPAFTRGALGKIATSIFDDYWDASVLVPNRQLS